MKNILAVILLIGLMFGSIVFGNSINIANSYDRLDEGTAVELYTTKKPEEIESLTAVPYYIIKTSVGERNEVINKLKLEDIEVVGESVILPNFSYIKKEQVLKLFNIKTYEEVSLNGVIVLEAKNAQVAFSGNFVKVGFPKILGSF